MEGSYREALESVHQTVGKVTHANDITTSCGYADDYPAELEKELFAAVKSGDIENTRIYGERYMDWMQSYEPELKSVVRLKAMEFVLLQSIWPMCREDCPSTGSRTGKATWSSSSPLDPTRSCGTGS